VHSAEFGSLYRSYSCVSWHPGVGWLLTIGFASAGPLGLLTATDKTFFIGLTVVGSFLAILFAVATIRTGRLRLDLFETGMVFHEPGGGNWSCKYSDIDKVFVQKGNIEGIKLALKDGSMREAMSIREMDDAVNFILMKL
jgi:hypothetical protein